MTRLRLVFPVLVVVLLGTAAYAQEAAPLRNWAAPIYWSPWTGDEVPLHGRQPGALSPKYSLAGTAVPLPFVAAAPCRLIDTRAGSGFPSGYGPPSLPGGTQRTFTIAGQCGIPADAQAVSFNFTVWVPVTRGDIRVFPAGGSTPLVSTLNWEANILALANAAIVPLGTGGAITVQVDGSGTIDLFVDVNGYYSPLGVVNSVNTLSGAVTIAGGNNVTVTPSGQTLSISATMPSGAGVYGKPGDTTLIGQGYTEVVPYDRESWAATSMTNVPSGRFWHCSVWTGTKMFVWGGQTSAPSSGLNSGGLYDPATDTWSATSVTGAVPSIRRFPSCVWTGSVVLVWGGESVADLSIYNDGARYDPVGNTWTAMSNTGAPAGRFQGAMVWAAEASPPRMLIWGGIDRHSGSGNETYPAAGGAYNPANDTWSSIDTTGQPAPRTSLSFVWTGAKLVVWGGYAGQNPSWIPFNDGGRYDPATDTWAATGATTLSARYSAPGVWTGSRMIVWGGYSSSHLGDGALYDPVGDAWTPMTGTGAPTARYSHVAVWTGSRMIIWSGMTGTGVTKSGGIYDPASNTWRTMTMTNAPVENYGYTGHWTGVPLNEMVVWGGYSSIGGLYRTMSLFVKN